MRQGWLVVVVLMVSVATAAAEDKLVKQYAGKIVISPDPAPTLAAELPAYIKANATKDAHYEAIKGSPWEIYLVGFLAKQPKSQVMLEIVDAATPKAAPLVALEVGAKQRLVISHTKVTTAAGFEVNKTYVVRLVANKQVLAKAELKLRD